jgi:hypothetical protein
MRILVCGGRDYGDLASLNQNRNDPRWAKRKQEYSLIFKTLDKIAWDRRGDNEPDEDGNWLPQVFIISGAARGADSAAADWSVLNLCPGKEYPADWDTHGRAAGYIRNKQMLKEGKPDLVVAFPGGKGTANMVKLARDAGVEVIEVAEDGSFKH